MRSDSEACLKKYKVVTFGNKKVLEHADQSIPQNETVHYMAPTNITVTSRNTNRPTIYTGALVITNKAVYIFHKTLVEKGVEQFDMADAERVSYKSTGMQASQFELTMERVTIGFLVSYNQNAAQSLYEDITKLIETSKALKPSGLAPAAPPAQPAPQATTAEELRQYKALLDDGVITQEEFDAKKKQLLGL